MWVVFAEIMLSFPGGFILGMVAPLNFAKLDNLVAGDSAGKFKNPDWLLLICQIIVQLSRFQRYYISERNVGHLRVALLQLRNVEHIVNS